MTAAALRRPTPDPHLLQRCLLLAALLHVWLVLVFGNASGTAAPGQGVWGSLTVKLTGRSGSDATAPPSTSSVQGGARAETEPGAARLGRSNPHEVAQEAARTEEASDAPPSTATLELPPEFKPVERETLDAPAPAGQPLPPSAQLPAAVGRLDTRPEAGLTPLPAAADLRTPQRAVELPSLPADLPATVSRMDAAAPVAAAAELPRPADLRPTPPTARATPTVELPAPVRRLDGAVPNTADPTLPRPAELRALPTAQAPVAATPSVALPAPVRRLEAPAESAAAPSLPKAAELRPTPPSALSTAPPTAALPSAVQRLEAPATDARAATSLPRPGELRSPTSTPTSAAPALSSQDLPAAVRRLESGEATTSVSALPSPAATRATTSPPGAASLGELSQSLPGEVNAPAAPAGVAKGDPEANPYAAPKASAGAPDAGSRLGPDVPAPPSAAASAARAPLNLSLPRGDIAARRSPGLIDMLPQPPERKSKLEQSIENAANQDCRKAYANAGLLAVVPLAIDAARGKGCKW